VGNLLLSPLISLDAQIDPAGTEHHARQRYHCPSLSRAILYEINNTKVEHINSYEPVCLFKIQILNAFFHHPPLSFCLLVFCVRMRARKNYAGSSNLQD